MEGPRLALCISFNCGIRDQAYETLSKRAWNLPRMLGSYGAALRRVAELRSTTRFFLKA